MKRHGAVIIVKYAFLRAGGLIKTVYCEGRHILIYVKQ